MKQIFIALILLITANVHAQGKKPFRYYNSFVWEDIISHGDMSKPEPRLPDSVPVNKPTYYELYSDTLKPSMIFMFKAPVGAEDHPAVNWKNVQAMNAWMDSCERIESILPPIKTDTIFWKGDTLFITGYGPWECGHRKVIFKKRKP